MARIYSINRGENNNGAHGRWHLSLVVGNQFEILQDHVDQEQMHH
jgi:hypothetical protein